jgi:hypothetical protein
MSEGNVEIALQQIDAFNRRDADGRWCAQLSSSDYVSEATEALPVDSSIPRISEHCERFRANGEPRRAFASLAPTHAR